MEEIDLTKSKFIPEHEIYLISIVESIRENYPSVDLENELKQIGYTLDDLIDPEKIVSFMKNLNDKYPD